MKKGFKSAVLQLHYIKNSQQGKIEITVRYKLEEKDGDTENGKNLLKRKKNVKGFQFKKIEK